MAGLRTRATAGRWRLLALAGCAVVAAGALLSACGGGDGGGGGYGGGTPSPQSTPVTGATDFRATHPEWLTRNHRTGAITYPMSPPAGGDHNAVWQNCNGEVYSAPVGPENAVHSLEHGAVWVTYRPDLPADQVSALTAKVRDRPYMFMSPYPNLDAKVSLQAWGFQLKVDSASDPRIDAFIAAHRMTASLEPGAPCSGGTTSTR